MYWKRPSQPVVGLPAAPSDQLRHANSIGCRGRCGRCSRVRGPQGNGHLQGPDREIAFQAVGSPADDAPGMQIEDDSEIQPALAGPDVADVARPFPVRPIRREVTLQQVRRNVEPVTAIRPSSGK